MLRYRLERLCIAFLGAPIPDEILKQICEHYRTTLKELECSHLTDNSLAVIANTIAPSLRYLSVMCSNISDTNLRSFLSGCSMLETLDLTLCMSVAPTTVQHIREFIKEVIASHTPEDFTLELSTGEDGKIIATPKLRDGGDIGLAREVATGKMILMVKVID